jgi:hypothetical protein
MTKRTVVGILVFSVIAGAALSLRPISHTDDTARFESDAANPVDYERANAQSVSSDAPPPTLPNRASPAFIFRRSGSAPLSAAGQCSRGQVHASFAPNVAFRSLSVTVIDVRANGRIPRPFELFIDDVRDDVIEGHFSAADTCALRLVSPHGPTDPPPLKHAGVA